MSGISPNVMQILDLAAPGGSLRKYLLSLELTDQERLSPDEPLCGLVTMNKILVCESCHRQVDWLMLQDGRLLCRECLIQLITDTIVLQPIQGRRLYERLIRFSVNTLSRH